MSSLVSTITVTRKVSKLYTRVSLLGNKFDWLDVAEWLADRGAQKIVIVVKRCLTTTTNCRRFDNNHIVKYRWHSEQVV